MRQVGIVFLEKINVLVIVSPFEANELFRLYKEQMINDNDSDDSDSDDNEIQFSSFIGMYAPRLTNLRSKIFFDSPNLSFPKMSMTKIEFSNQTNELLPIISIFSGAQFINDQNEKLSY